MRAPFSKTFLIRPHHVIVSSWEVGVPTSGELQLVAIVSANRTARSIPHLLDARRSLSSGNRVSRFVPIG